jgi:aerobic carbon-monoxide dehydrogenase medium subunit
MIPESFEYFAPDNLDEALRLLAEHGDDAKVLAGGHSLIPLMKLRLAAPAVLVDLGRIGSLKGITTNNGTTRIGAMTTHYEVGHYEGLVTGATALHQAANVIGDQQVRNRGTIGGSLAHADPAADYPAAALALGAELALKSQAGERTVAADDWFVDLLTTAIEPGEIVTEVRVPSWPNSAYVKYENPASEYAIVGVAAALKLSGDTVDDIRVGVTGAAARAYRASPVETALKGKTLSASAIKDAAAGAAEGQETMGDVHASEDYRAHLARLLTERALTAAWRR